jgi:CheY-like chemotaxis protein
MRVMMDGLVTVLIVEDDEVEATAIVRSFRDLKAEYPIVVTHHGKEALQRLRGENGFERISAPLLVLLDLSMPHMDGHEFLEALRGDPFLRPSTVFVLTSSASKKHRASTYAQNIAGYIRKPAPGQDFSDIVSMLNSYCRVNFGA